MGPPFANIPLQQPVAQPPAVVQGIPPPPAVPAPVQLPPVVAGGPPLPVIIVTPPSQPAAQGGQKYPGLEAIPEEDEEEDEPQPQGAGYRSPTSSSSLSSASDNTLTAEDFDTAPSTPAPRPKDPESPFGARGDDLLTEFWHLVFTPDANTPRRKYEIPADERREGAAKVPGAEKSFQHELANVGPPSQRTLQMQNDL